MTCGYLRGPRAGSDWVSGSAGCGVLWIRWLYGLGSALSVGDGEEDVVGWGGVEREVYDGFSIVFLLNERGGAGYAWVVRRGGTAVLWLRGGFVSG